MNAYLFTNTPQLAVGTSALGVSKGELRQSAPLWSPSAHSLRAGETSKPKIPRCLRWGILFKVMAMVGCLCSSGIASLSAADRLPGDSIYQLTAPLVDQDAQALQLGAKRGKPVLVSMFYTSCRYVCPLIIDTLLKTEHALAPADRAKLNVLLISFDPEHDSPAQLKTVADKRHLDLERWSLVRTEAVHVRKLAAVLGIQYRALADGDINHSNALVLLDHDGRIVGRTDVLGEIDAEFVATLKRVLAAY